MGPVSARDEFTDRLFAALDLPADARAVLEAHADAWRAQREAEVALEAEWVDGMFMALAEVCDGLSAELSQVLGVHVTVKYDTTPVVRLG